MATLRFRRRLMQTWNPGNLILSQESEALLAQRGKTVSMHFSVAMAKRRPGRRPTCLYTGRLFLQFHLAEERARRGLASIVSLQLLCNKHCQVILGKIGEGHFLFFSYTLSGSCQRNKTSTWSSVGVKTSTCRVCTGACAPKGGRSHPPLDPPPPEARTLLLPLTLSTSLTHLETGRLFIHGLARQEGDAIFMTCKDINKLAPGHINAPRRHFQIPRGRDVLFRMERK